MTNETDRQQTCEIVNDLNCIDETVRAKLADAIKSLALLYSLTDFKPKSADNVVDAATPA